MAKDRAILRAKIKDDHARQVHQLNEITGANVTPSEPEEDVITVAGDSTTTVNNTGAGKLATAAAVVAASALPLAGIGAYKLLDSTPTVDPPAVVAPVEPGTDRDTYVPYDFGIE